MSKYLDFIRSKPCCACGNSRTISHHIRSIKHIPNLLKGGIGLKSSDYACIPLCSICHDTIHKNPSEIEEKIDISKTIIQCLVDFINMKK